MLITAQLIKAHYLGEGENSKTLQEILTYHSKKLETTWTKDALLNFGVTEGHK